MSSVYFAILSTLLGTVLLVSGKQNPGPSSPAPPNVSVEAADSLGRKITAIRSAEHSASRSPGARTSILVSEIEMESFVFYSMTDEIPARVSSIDVTLYEGSIAAATELVFDGESDSDNPIVDLLMQNPHSLFVRGELAGREGRGRFQLQQVRVDGIPVPLVVVELLVKRFVSPRFPDVDLDEEFPIPWGIEGLSLSPEGAIVTY